MSDDMQAYLRGEKLYGDDFDLEQIKEWYQAEEEGYADKVRKREQDKGYEYHYHALNRAHGYGRLPADKRFGRVLGMGSAYGHELEPIADRIDSLTIVEPSELFTNTTVFGIPAEYVKPEVSGDMRFDSESFDLITCLGVLHHIPNVSHVFSEMVRCLAPGGFALVREPICSQGDWSRPRKNLTRNERGIPLQIFRDIIGKSGLRVVSERLCVFRPLVKLWWMAVKTPPFNSDLAVMLDMYCSRLFAWNYRYHNIKFHQRFTPVSVYYVLAK